MGQGNIFTSVCQEFCSWRGVPDPRGCLVRGVLLGGVYVLGGPGQGGSALGGAWSQGGAWWRPPGTATAAGGTHPTGMHSC